MKTILAPLVTAAALLAASQAQAHAHLVKAAPADASAVAAPKTVTLQFSEALEAKFSTITLKTAAGAETPAASTVGPDHKTLIATPKAALAPGAYRVVWKVVSADGHPMKGEYGFTVK